MVLMLLGFTQGFTGPLTTCLWVGQLLWLGRWLQPSFVLMLCRVMSSLVVFFLLQSACRCISAGQHFCLCHVDVCVSCERPCPVVGPALFAVSCTHRVVVVLVLLLLKL